MKVVFSEDGWAFDGHLNGELVKAFRRIICGICEVASSFEGHTSQGILMVVRCACLYEYSPELREHHRNGFVMVSPFAGLNRCGHKIATPGVHPPFLFPGKGDECATDEEFLEAWRETISAAIQEAERTSKRRKE